MTPHDSLLTSHALAVLAEVVRDRSGGSKQSPGVRLALRVLMPHAKRRRDLIDFWGFAGFADWDARRRACRPSLAAIAASVGRVGYCDRIR